MYAHTQIHTQTHKHAHTCTYTARGRAHTHTHVSIYVDRYYSVEFELLEVSGKTVMGTTYLQVYISTCASEDRACNHGNTPAHISVQLLVQVFLYR